MEVVKIEACRTMREFWAEYCDSLDETFYSEELKKYLREEEERIIRFCQKTNPEFVLEAGCGKGRIIEKILPYCKRIVGVDFSPGMVGFCSNKFRDNPNIRIYEEDISQMHFPDNYFDLGILAFNTLGNVNKKEKVLLELKRVLKPTGNLLISVYSDKAREAQYKTYSSLGLEIEKEENSIVYTKEGLISQRFSKADLEVLLQICGLKGDIKQLTDIGYFVEARNG